MSSTTPVRRMLQGLFERGEVLAQQARDAFCASPPNVAAGRRCLLDLHKLFETELRTIYSHVYSAPANRVSREFEYSPSGVAPFPNMADAIAEVVPSTITLDAH